MTTRSVDTQKAIEYLNSYEFFESAGVEFDGKSITLAEPIAYEFIDEAKVAADRFDDLFDIILIVRTDPPPPVQWDHVEFYNSLDEIAKQVIDGAIGDTVVDAWAREAWLHLQDHWIFSDDLVRLVDDHVDFINEKRLEYKKILDESR